MLQSAFRLPSNFLQVEVAAWHFLLLTNSLQQTNNITKNIHLVLNIYNCFIKMLYAELKLLFVNCQIMIFLDRLFEEFLFSTDFSCQFKAFP